MRLFRLDMCFGKAIDLKTSGGYQVYIFTTYSENYGVRPRTWGQSEMAYLFDHFAIILELLLLTDVYF